MPLRKMLNDVQAPYIQSLMRLIETQSTHTIAAWCVDYAQTHVLPLWSAVFAGDSRPADALAAARGYLAGEIALKAAKAQIMLCRAAAREAAANHVAQGAARTIDAAASAIHNPAGSISLAFYGALTIAYARLGTDAAWDALAAAAAEQCAHMQAALADIAVADEPNPAKIRWGC